MGTKNNRGNNQRTYALYEELRHLRVFPQAEVPYIYKRLDRQQDLPVEERVYQVRVPVPMEKGVRKSLRTSDRTTAIERAEDLVRAIKSVLRAGGTASKVTAEDLVSRFLKTKSARIREEDEGKSDAGRRSIIKERYALIEGKLRNYLVPFLGKSTDVKSVPLSKWNEWEVWRKDNKHTRRAKNPKAITIQNEMGMIRECWKWGMESALLPFSPKLPFQNENLITDDKVRRDTWEPHEWNSFARRVRDWLNTQSEGTEKQVWDAFVAYQMVFFLANSGMRTGELVKVRSMLWAVS